MKKTGILGGTFNPIHNGHLLLAETARDEFGLENVLFIPSGCSYMKNQSEILPGKLRSRMVSLAIADNPYFSMTNMEIEREGNSYTYETLAELRRVSPDTVFYYIIGADTLFTMETWKHPELIFGQAVILAAVRDDFRQQELKSQILYLHQKYGADIRLLHAGNVQISSTIIRRKRKENQSIRYLVQEPVRKFIEENDLYQS